jgi:branched-chain amino acid transport system permease protein
LPYFVFLILITLGFLATTGIRSMIMLVIIYSIYAMAFGLLLGYLNLPSLGHSIFFGLGAYGMTIPIINWGWSFWGALGFAILIGALGGLVVGFFAVRLATDSHVIFTVAVAFTIFLLAQNLVPLTGGSGGMAVAFPLLFERPINISLYNPLYTYLLCVFFGFAVYLFLERITNTPLGKIWVGIRENETRISFLGYNVFYYKLSAFVLSSALTALAGALLVMRLRYVTADYFSFQWAILPFVWVILGGTGTLVGPIIGVILLTYFQYYVSEWWTHYHLLFGILILIILRWAPNGVISYFKIIGDWMRKTKREEHSDDKR